MKQILFLFLIASTSSAYAHSFENFVLCSLHKIVSSKHSNSRTTVKGSPLLLERKDYRSRELTIDGVSGITFELVKTDSTVYFKAEAEVQDVTHKVGEIEIDTLFSPRNVRKTRETAGYFPLVNPQDNWQGKQVQLKAVCEGISQREAIKMIFNETQEQDKVKKILN